MTNLRPPGTEMGILEILARVKNLAEEWEMRRGNTQTKYAGWAAEDFKRLQTDIEKSLEEQGDRMMEEHLKNEGKKE